ncbi:hypothetical protein [Leptospirillum ferriphilum]|nr:hypothetical protein [Leptospirillum ferriphilum]
MISDLPALDLALFAVDTVRPAKGFDAGGSFPETGDLLIVPGQNMPEI